jgi:hypothetical protein
MRVLTTTGVQSETTLPFAGLHQLLRPILGEVGELPSRQRDALLAAFGMTDRAAPDLFLIALAALELLAGVAARSPLLLIAEDAHWLDRSTADVLAFVARRLESEPMVLLAAVREGFESDLVEAGLPELRLEGLDEASSGALLDAWAPDLAGTVRERLLEEAAGNPLALVELPAALRSEQRRGGTSLPSVLPLTTRLERAFLARASELPDATRTVLLVAAVDDGNDVAEVLRAAAIVEEMESGEEALASALSTGLVEIDGAELWFRHPLVRSAIHQAASISQRRAAHAALAEVLSGQPDRSIWHRAASVLAPMRRWRPSWRWRRSRRSTAEPSQWQSRRWSVQRSSPTIPPVGVTDSCVPPSWHLNWAGVTWWSVWSERLSRSSWDPSSGGG